MATTDYDFNLTRNEIIARAYRIIGVLSDGDTLSGQQLSQGADALNTILKDWENDGIFLWNMQEKSQSVIASTTSYTVANDIIGIDRAWYVTNGRVEPVEIKSYRDYKLLNDTTETSDTPDIVALGHEISSPTLYVWPTPSAAYTLYYIAVTQLKDLDSSSGSPEIPQRFLKAITYKLASDLADENVLDIRERSYLEEKSERLFLKAKRRDSEQRTSDEVEGAFLTRRR